LGVPCHKFYRDPLSDQILPSADEIWENESRLQTVISNGTRDGSPRRQTQTARNFLRSGKLSNWLAEELTAEAPTVGGVFQASDRLAGVGNDGQIIYQHARLWQLLSTVPPRTVDRAHVRDGIASGAHSELLSSCHKAGMLIDDLSVVTDPGGAVRGLEYAAHCRSLSRQLLASSWESFPLRRKLRAVLRLTTLANHLLVPLESRSANGLSSPRSRAALGRDLI